jgi:hypothetical protein
MCDVDVDTLTLLIKAGADARTLGVTLLHMAARARRKDKVDQQDQCNERRRKRLGEEDVPGGRQGHPDIDHQKDEGALHARISPRSCGRPTASWPASRQEMQNLENLADNDELDDDDEGPSATRSTTRRPGKRHRPSPAVMASERMVHGRQPCH